MNNVIQLDHLLSKYNTIEWASNYSKEDNKTHTYGGIIGYDTKRKLHGKKISRIPEVFYRPAYTGNYYYLDVDFKREPAVNLYLHSGPIKKKRLVGRKLEELKKTEWSSVVESTMPPIVQSFGGEIIPTAVDEEDRFREWGYYMGNLNDIEKYKNDFLKNEGYPSKIANVQIRFSPYIFALSSYVNAPQDYHYYLAGCIYYNMTPSDIKQELTTMFRLNPEKYHYERILALLELKLGSRANVNRDIEIGGVGTISYSKKTNDLSVNRLKIPELKNIVIKKNTQDTSSLENSDVFQVELSGEKFQEILQESDYEYYPKISDPKFECNLLKKNEFQALKQESITNKTMKDLCPTTEFPKLKSQEIVRNFMRPDTPYMGLLVYHGLGTGKTCLSIQVAETFKPLVRKLGKKILVIVSKSILENYLKELYNFSKEPLEKKNNLPRGTLQCTGLTYAPPTGLDMEDKIKIRNSKIKQYYEIITYMGIKKMFYEIARFYINTNKKFEFEDAKKVCENKIFIGKLRELFNDRLIIIDEVHNMRESTNEDEKISSYILELILKNCSRIKLLLLTATPIYNQPSEIFYILNLLRINEKLSPVTGNMSDFFDRTDFRSGKKDEFKKFWRGRISYVRGENPVNFPEKVYPEMKLIYTPKWDFSYTKKKNVPNVFNKYYPIPLVFARMSNYQERIYMGEIELSNLDAETKAQPEINMESFHFKKKQISNIVYPTSHPSEIPKMHGTRGFQNCFVSETKKGGVYKGPYKPSRDAMIDGTFFMDESIIVNYSPKMSIIFEQIKNNPDKLIFVYSEYLEGAVIPFCLMLEYHGFTRYGDNSLFAGNKKRPSSIKDKKYVLLDGSIPSQKRSMWVSKFNEPENKNGKNIQVIIGTKVMGEGIDLKNIRQIHIFNPWFNMSRIDQIIGRGVRHCSHLDFADESDRNVMIFIYSATLFDRVSNSSKIESTDEYIYRMAISKDVLFQRIFKSLREVAFDCNLNHLINYFPQYDKDNTRECAYKKCDLICDPICTFTKSMIDYSTYEPHLTAENLKKMEKKILSAMRESKKSFTLRELVISVFNNDVSLSELELFKYVLKQLINDKKVIYTGYQYVAVPNKFYDYVKMGLEYVLYSYQRLPDKTLTYIPQNLETQLEYKEREGKRQSMKERQMYDAQLEKINEYNIDEWFKDIKNIMESKNYNRVLQGLDVLNDNLVYRFFMNSFPFHIIIYYLKNACINNRIEEFQNAFGYLLFAPPKYQSSVLFLDLSITTKDKLIMFDILEKKFKRGVDYVYFSDNYAKRKNIVPLFSIEEFMLIKPEKINQIYGIIQYNEKNGSYIFKIVDKTLEFKRKKIVKTSAIRGENCSTKSMPNKKAILLSLINQYNKSNIDKIPDSFKVLRSLDLCILIQYMLFKLQLKEKTTLFIFEEKI